MYDPAVFNAAWHEKCATCGAEPGSNCVTQTGARASEPHVARQEKAKVGMREKGRDDEFDAFRR